MANPKGMSIYHLVIDTKEYEKFRRNYPKLLKIFLNRAVKLANNDKSVFEKIFFSEIGE